MEIVFAILAALAALFGGALWFDRRGYRRGVSDRSAEQERAHAKAKRELEQAQRDEQLRQERRQKLLEQQMADLDKATVDALRKEPPTLFEAEDDSTRSINAAIAAEKADAKRRKS